MEYNKMRDIQSVFNFVSKNITLFKSGGFAVYLRWKYTYITGSIWYFIFLEVSYLKLESYSMSKLSFLLVYCTDLCYFKRDNAYKSVMKIAEHNYNYNLM